METGGLDSALRQAIKTALRFPLVLLFSLAGTVAALRFNHAPHSHPELRMEALRLMLALWLGIPLLLSLAVFSEGRRQALAGRSARFDRSRRVERILAWGLQAAGALLIAAYWQSLAHGSHAERILRFWLLMASAHLLLALSPALRPGAGEGDFWSFNLAMLAHGAKSLLHAGAVMLGLTVALAAVKSLFSLPIPDHAFLDPVLVTLGVFHTWHFLAGVPPAAPAGAASAFADPSDHPAYPRSLRRAAQFILLPLMAVYLLILYAYALKSLVTWTWPAGGGTWLILCFCALGMITLFLIQPLAEREGPPGPGESPWAAEWFRFFGRHFYPGLLPLLVLLFAAIGRRVYEYSLTENRYLVMALAVWLSGVALHTLIDRRRDLRILPASLCLVSLLAAFGPWGAFEVARKSQVQRLGKILEAEGMLVGGKLAKAPGPVSRESKREITAIAGYLETRGRLGELTPWLPSLDDTARTHPVVWLGALENRFAFLQALELPYVPEHKGGDAEADGLAFLCRACENPLKRVSGFDLLFVDLRSENLPGEGRELPVAEPDGPQGLRFAFQPDSGLLRFSALDSAVLDLDLNAYFQGLRDRYPDAYDLNLPEEEMVLEREGDRLKVRLRLRSMRGRLEQDSARLKAFAADVFVQVKGRQRVRR